MGTGKMLGFQSPGETMAGKVTATLEMVKIQSQKSQWGSELKDENRQEMLASDHK